MKTIAPSPLSIATCVLLLSLSTESRAAEQVFGLTIGAPLAVPSCTRRGMAPDVPATGACSINAEAVKEGSSYTGNSLVVFAPDQLPLWARSEDLPYDHISVRLIDGALAGATIYTRGESVQNLTLSALTEKYGKPKSKVPRNLQNGFGARFTANSYEWQIREIIVEYETFDSSVDRGTVRVGTRKATELRRKEEDEARARFLRGKTAL